MSGQLVSSKTSSKDVKTAEIRTSHHHFIKEAGMALKASLPSVGACARACGGRAQGLC